MQTSDPKSILKGWKHSGPAFATQLVSWYQQNKKDWPWRRFFADHGDPFHIWVSEIMLQQTTIQAVLPAYERFFRMFPDIHAFARASEEQVRESCRGLGYYRRFGLLHKAAKQLSEAAGGQGRVSWPASFAAWRELPGVGDYTAAAISSIAFGIPKAVVDGNVERVFSRLFCLDIVPDLKWKKVFQAIGDQFIPAESPSDFNQGLMELGQSLCIKQNPRCGACPVQTYCQAYAAGRQTEIPRAKEKMTFEDVEIASYILEKRGRVALMERKSDARFLKNTWGFPCAILKDKKLVWETAALPVDRSDLIGTVKHGITKHRIEVKVHRLDMGEEPEGLRWLKRDEVEAQLLSNLDRKAWLHYLKADKPAALDLRFDN